MHQQSQTDDASPIRLTGSLSWSSTQVAKPTTAPAPIRLRRGV
jgi:hypothetical protein